MKQRSGYTFRRCSALRCVCLLAACTGLGLALPVQASDQLLIGAGRSETVSGSRAGADADAGGADNGSSGAAGNDSTGSRAGTDTEAEGSSLSDTSLGGAGYNGGPTMLGSGSTLTVENTRDEYEWVKTNMAGRFYPYVIVHAEGNPNVIHFLYEYGHDYKSPAAFHYTDEEKKTFTDTGKSGAARVPLIMQWDYRWGFNWYGGGPAGLTACAPTCMTMIGLGLTGKETYTVPAMCSYAEGKGYWVSGQGTSWSLVTDAFPDDPITCQQISVDEESIASALQAGNPVLINVGVGKFSAVGHFMVLTGVDKGGKFVLNDPNNLENSSKTWAWADLASEIQAAWAYALSSS